MAEQASDSIKTTEGKISPEDLELLHKGIASGKRIVFVTYSLTDTIERQLDSLIALILKRYGKESLQATLYSCVKEIVVNATKANAKKVFFEEIGLRLNDATDYAGGMKKLKQALSESWIQEYGKKAKDKGLDVTIAFKHSEDGLRIEVRNDAEILPADEERIRQKLAEGTTYEDLVSFYMKNADNTEGEGIGLVMNLMLLKAENINPALFRIGMVDGKALSRLEIPFTDKFKSVRGPDPGSFGIVTDDDLRIDYR